MNLTKSFIIGKANHLLYSVVEASKDSEDSTHRKNVVEVGNDVVSVVESYVKACISNNNAGNAPNGEKKDKTNSEKHRGAEIKRAPSHSC